MRAPLHGRRRWLMHAAAGMAVLGGIGLAGRMSRSPVTPPAAESSGLWSLQFATPAGGLLSMASWRGKPLLLNFWATWCPPCVEELPLLNQFHRAHSAQGWQVLGLAVDQAEPVRRFLAQTPVTFPVALAGFPGLELSKSLGNLSGGLPFTVVLGSGGAVRHRKMGRVTPDDLRAWAVLQ